MKKIKKTKKIKADSAFVFAALVLVLGSSVFLSCGGNSNQRNQNNSGRTIGSPEPNNSDNTTVNSEEKTMSEKIVQTAGRDRLGEFAPDFAHYNDDVLFGENWNSGGISVKTRCIVTVVSLMSQGIVDSSLRHHLENAKRNGVTQKEIAAVITHNAFYAGWPKAWAVFNLAKEVWPEISEDEISSGGQGQIQESEQPGGFFGLGEPNNAYARYFIGNSYLNRLTKQGDPIGISNVTFEPSCRNNWHIHHASSGGGQVLICVSGEGWYQEWGKPAQSLKPGDIVEIPANVKHWHGAKKDSWFSHLAFEIPGENPSNEWLEPVNDEEYSKL